MPLSYNAVYKKAVKHNLTESSFNKAFLYFIILFTLIFVAFIIREYRMHIKPYKQALHVGTKRSELFVVKKHYDPVYKNYLLHHPSQKDMYILLPEKMFKSLPDEAIAELITTPTFGLPMALKVNDQLYTEIENFSFKGES